MNSCKGTARLLLLWLTLQSAYSVQAAWLQVCMSQLHASCLQAGDLLNEAILFAQAEEFDEQAHAAFAAAAFPGLPKTKADLVVAANFVQRGTVELHSALLNLKE